MSRSLAVPMEVPRGARAWLGVLSVLALAVATGLVVARIVLAPTADDMRALAVYLMFSAVLSLGIGWAALTVTERAVGLAIRTRAFLCAAAGNAIALLNVVIVARLMFLSTTHDLPLLFVLLVFSGVITVFFNLVAAVMLTRRLGLVAGGVDALVQGDYRVRLAVDGADEVAQLAGQLNQLAHRLQDTDEQQRAMERERRELTAAISHDLRTPLASVRAMVEALDDRIVDDPDEVNRYYGAIRREIERLNRMIDDLFALARLDAGALKLDKRRLSLVELVTDVVDSMQAQARRSSINLQFVSDSPAPAPLLDGDWIARAVGNLVRNALEYTPSGGRVDVQVRVDHPWAELRVTDSGPGIEESDLSQIWQRFYRGDRSRRRGPKTSDGAGLGLAIVRGVTEAHGGSVSVHSAPGHGATFAMRLPL